MAEVRVRNVGQVQDHPRPCVRHCFEPVINGYCGRWCDLGATRQLSQAGAKVHKTLMTSMDTEPFRRPAVRATMESDHAHSPLLAQAVRPLTALRAPCLLRRLVASQLLASRALVASQLVRFADLAVPASRDLILSAGDMVHFGILASHLGFI